MLQRELDVDIVITGHTHKFEAYEFGDKFFVNPGSATGAYSGLTRSRSPSSSFLHLPLLTLFIHLTSPLISDVNPSFVLMDIQGSNVVTFVYQLINGEVKVDKLEYKKK